MTTLCGAYGYSVDDYWDSEPVDLWRERKVRARKQHECCECDGTIQPGQVYGQATHLCDGTWYTDRRCPACLILAEQVATILGECPLWNQLELTIAERVNSAAGHHLPSPREHRRLWEAAGSITTQEGAPS